MRGTEVALPSNGAMATGAALLAADALNQMGPVYIADSIRKTRRKKVRGLAFLFGEFTNSFSAPFAEE